MTRKYSSISVETTLQSTINSTTTSIVVATGTATAFMGGVTLAAGNVDQFTIAIDPDTVNEEIVFVTGVNSDTLTVVRQQAGSTGVSHTAGATVRHVLTSDDLTFYTTGVATANAAIPKTLTTTTGDIIYASSANTPARLAIGSTGQALVVASGIPSWGTITATPRIGQVVTATTTSSTASTGGAGFVDVSGLSVTITPTLSTSKILIVTSFGLLGSGTTYQSGLVQLLRGATSLTIPVVGPYYPSGGGVNTANYIPFSLQYVDSPATTSATTYKIQISNVFSATNWVANSSAVSVQISAMEVLV
jgi:hypothetical protein